MNSLRGIRLLQNQVKHDKNLCLLNFNKKYFHVESKLLKDQKFSEKPLYLKKLKIKQARMQKDDGVPVFLKAGLRDKFLYNITLIGVIAGTLYSFKTLYQLSQDFK